MRKNKTSSINDWTPDSFSVSPYQSGRLAAVNHQADSYHPILRRHHNHERRFEIAKLAHGPSQCSK